MPCQKNQGHIFSCKATKKEFFCQVLWGFPEMSTIVLFVFLGLVEVDMVGQETLLIWNSELHSLFPTLLGKNTPVLV